MPAKISIEALVLDADVFDSILGDANPAKKAKEVENKRIAHLRKHAGDPKFSELVE
jgi:type I restriction enzyme, R subunit